MEQETKQVVEKVYEFLFSTYRIQSQGRTMDFYPVEDDELFEDVGFPSFEMERDGEMEDIDKEESFFQDVEMSDDVVEVDMTIETVQDLESYIRLLPPELGLLYDDLSISSFQFEQLKRQVSHLFRNFKQHEKRKKEEVHPCLQPFLNKEDVIRPHNQTTKPRHQWLIPIIDDYRLSQSEETNIKERVVMTNTTLTIQSNGQQYSLSEPYEKNYNAISDNNLPNREYVKKIRSYTHGYRYPIQSIEEATDREAKDCQIQSTPMVYPYQYDCKEEKTRIDNSYTAPLLRLGSLSLSKIGQRPQLIRDKHAFTFRQGVSENKMRSYHFSKNRIASNRMDKWSCDAYDVVGTKCDPIHEGETVRLRGFLKLPVGQNIYGTPLSMFRLRRTRVKQNSTV